MIFSKDKVYYWTRGAKYHFAPRVADSLIKNVKIKSAFLWIKVLVHGGITSCMPLRYVCINYLRIKVQKQLGLHLNAYVQSDKR